MGSSPYRVASQRVEEEDSNEFSELELLPILAILWLASIARLVVAIAARESLDQEWVFALGLVLLVPVLGRHGFRRLVRRLMRRG